MNKKLTIALSLIILLAVCVAAQVNAQTRAPGVKSGDNFVYTVSSSWTSNNESLVIPQYLLEINKTLSYNLTVTLVAEFNVTAINTWRLNNGTDIDALVTLDSDNGNLLFAVYGRPAFQGFFDANLNAGGHLYPGNETLGIIINQTIPRDYPSGKRDINVVSLSTPIQDVINNSTGTQTDTFYVDKEYGVLVERVINSEFSDHSAVETWKLKETNLWNVGASSAPELPLMYIAIIAATVVIAVVVVVLVFRGRKRGGKKFRK